MKKKEKFLNAIEGLFNYWGSDAPPEAYWVGNDLLEWYEKEFDVELNIRFNEESQNFEDVIEQIKKI